MPRFPLVTVRSHFIVQSWVKNQRTINYQRAALEKKKKRKSVLSPPSSTFIFDVNPLRLPEECTLLLLSLFLDCVTAICFNLEPWERFHSPLVKSGAASSKSALRPPGRVQNRSRCLLSSSRRWALIDSTRIFAALSWQHTEAAQPSLVFKRASTLVPRLWWSAALRSYVDTAARFPLIVSINSVDWPSRLLASC